MSTYIRIIQYKDISERTSTKNGLSASQKKTLFRNFINTETKFTNVSDEKLKQLRLFCDVHGNILPLKELLPYNLNTPTWLLTFKVQAEEYSDILVKYLLQEQDIYKSLILPNWETITINIQEPKSFYEKVIYYFNLEENNTPLSKQAFIHTIDGFKKSQEIFYNVRFNNDTKYYIFQSAVEKIFGTNIPSKDIFNFLKDVPFKVDNSNLLDNEIVKGVSLDVDEIKSLVSFTISNNENFFDKFINTIYFHFTVSCLIMHRNNNSWLNLLNNFHGFFGI